MKKFHYLSVFVITCGIMSCTELRPKDKPTYTDKPKVEVAVPYFDADTAYHYIETQVKMGPRTWGSKAHKDCGDWAIAKLKLSNAQVLVQATTLKLYNGKVIPMRNIMGQLYPDKKNRILLAAHYDSRPYADHDDERQTEPILAADDGASGVAVLLEIARLLNISEPMYGVDILLIDAEETGAPNYAPNTNARNEDWCLGSQYWSHNIIPMGYRPEYGILLDMVGGRGNTFTQEATSMMYAPDVMNKIWKTGNRLGYSSYFLYDKTQVVVDDHYFINQIAKIPTVDIIHYYKPSETTDIPMFGPWWHTHDDDMDNIDKATLKAVGQTILTVLYESGV